MRIKGFVDEDFVNYRKPAAFIGTSFCDWKCCVEQGLDTSVCQNAALANSKSLEMPAEEIFRRYIQNPITKAVVIGGLEPFLQFDELINLVQTFRESGCMDDIVIYTGYYPQEIRQQLSELSKHKNIIVKFGRFIPNQKPHYDPVLGIKLASDNQFGRRLDESEIEQ